MKELNPKTIKNRIRLLKALPYKSHMVYIRMIGTDLFEWLLVHNGEIYSSNMRFTPRKGTTKLSNSEISQAAGLIWAGAVATIETLIGNKIETPEKVNTFVEATKKVN